MAALRQSPGNKFAATRIGQWVINLKQVEIQELLNGELMSALNKKVFRVIFLMTSWVLQKNIWRQVRVTIQKLFSAGSKLKDNEELRGMIVQNSQKQSTTCHHKLVISPISHHPFLMPTTMVFIRGGPAGTLNENWLHLPIGYHGRASSVVMSGTPVRRARGQIKEPESDYPIFTECKRMDYEVELAAFIGGPSNQLGKPIKVKNAWDRVFGLVLLNDWSYRDFMMWQFRPLGPFTCKNGITSISPWIITLDALSDCQNKTRLTTTSPSILPRRTKSQILQHRSLASLQNPKNDLA